MDIINDLSRLEKNCLKQQMYADYFLDGINGTDVYFKYICLADIAILWDITEGLI